MENDPEWLLQEKKLKNKSADKKQYEKYKAVLGKKEVGSFDNFQNMKYTNKKGWYDIKQRKRKEMKENKNFLKIRTQRQLQKVAENMKVLAEQYSASPSKWSGNIIIDDELNNDNVLGEKRINCDIAVVKNVGDDTILHEMFHSCSASHYDHSVYVNNQFIEEASVEFLTQQVCQKQNITFKQSYEDLIEILQLLNKGLNFGTDLEFARKLFHVPLPNRYNWLKDEVLKRIKKENASLKDCEEMEIYLKQLEGGLFYDKG